MISGDFNEENKLIELEVITIDGMKFPKPYYVSFIVNKNNPQTIAEDLETNINIYELSYDKDSVIKRCKERNKIIKEILNKRIKELQRILEHFE